MQGNENSHKGIVEKVQETSWDTDMHSTVHSCHHHTGCVLECRDTPHHRRPQIYVGLQIIVC